MLCEKCKEREAVISVVEIINGTKKTHMLCSECAKHIKLPNGVPDIEGNFDISKIVTGIIGKAVVRENLGVNEKIVCPSCNTSFAKYLKTKRLGCADCYEVFGLLMDNELKRAVRNQKYTGKRPKIRVQEQPEQVEEKKTKIDTIDTLRNRLQIAVSLEEYDEAAQIRDRIKALERNEIDV